MSKDKKVKKTKKNNSILKTFLLALTICMIIYVLYKIIKLIVNPTETFIIEKGTITSEESTVGYVIRDETIIESDNSDTTTIVQIKKEGEKVGKQNPVFKYYNIDEKEINTQIEELNVKIQEALEEQKGILPSDVKSIESQIEKKLDNLKDKNSIQEIEEYKEDIENYVVKKATIAGSLSSAGKYINSLISERADLEEKLTKEAKYVYSPQSGIISYRIDNLENELTINNLSELSTELLEGFNLKTGQIVSTSTKNAKVVNNYECYIAVSLNSDEAKNAEVGDKVNLRISGNEKISAVIEQINEEKNNRLIIFKITKNVENLVAYRKVSVDVIWWEYEGLRAPVSAIIYQNGLSYVERKKNGTYSRVLVEIIRENGNYCIIDQYDTEKLNNLGYTAEEINNMSVIKLYDEIVANPEPD